MGVMSDTVEKYYRQGKFGEITETRCMVVRVTQLHRPGNNHSTNTKHNDSHDHSNRHNSPSIVSSPITLPSFAKAEPEITAEKILSEVALTPQADPHRVASASASARSNQIFPSFKTDTLKPFTTAALNSFRTYIRGMSRIVDFTGNVIGYPAPRSLPGNHGHAMRNEVDVRTFANSLYIDPAKAVMLEMLPDAALRTYYDWVVLSEAMPPPTLSVEIQSIPDMALARRIRHLNSINGPVERDFPVLLIEFTAPSVVFLARNSAQSHRDESPDWKAMTKQLRKYAVLCKCHRLILMDERLACFFYLPAADLMDPNQSIHYLSAEAPVVGIHSTLSRGLPLRLAVTTLIAQTPIDSSADLLATRTQILNASSSTAILLPSIDGPSVATPNVSATIDQVRPIAALGTASTGNACVAGQTGSTATQQPGPDSDSTPSFTVRELLAFAAWHALGDEPGAIQRKDYHHIGMEVQPCAYTPLARWDAGTYPGPKPGGDEHKRQAPASRKRKQTVFFPAVEHPTMLLKRCDYIDMSPDDYRFDDTSVYHTTYSGIYLYPCMRCSEPDAESGYHSDTEHHRSASAGVSCRHEKGTNTLRLHLSRQNLLSSLSILDLTRVRKLSDRVSTGHLMSSLHASFPDITVVFKRFEKRSYLFRELLAYAQLHHLQGAEIPGCYGVFTNGHDGADSALYLALENIHCGTVAAGTWSSGTIKALLPEAQSALDAIHRAGVCHGDISARNVLVDPEDERGVILVDFDLSIVDCGIESAWAGEDRAALEWVFGPGLEC